MYATVASMIDLFNMDNIRILKSMGYKVDVAANFEEGNVTSKERISQFKIELDKLNIDYYHIPFPRSIGNFKDLKKSYNMTLEIKNKKKYDLVHCHTPIASAIGRFAFRNSESRLIYTAHGFHFYKGAPLKNWLLFYPAERFLSKYTDILITINQEDYNNAQKFKAKETSYVPGVGIDLPKYADSNTEDINLLKRQLNLSDSDFILFSTGELNKNKNHEVVIRAIAQLNKPSIHYIIAGQGPLNTYLSNLAKELKIDKQIHLLGYRDDIPKILKIADVFIFPSIREGLSVSLMEAMAMGKPVIASNIRGNKDLIDVNYGGYLCEVYDVKMYSRYIDFIFNNRINNFKFGAYNQKKIRNFSILEVNKKMREIYNEII